METETKTETEPRALNPLPETRNPTDLPTYGTTYERGVVDGTMVRDGCNTLLSLRYQVRVSK